MFGKTIVAAAGIALAALLPAWAQNFPIKPLTMVIPFAAGGPTDVLGRVVGARMSEILGQQVIIENVGGAGGMTGSRRVADSKPDGYTFVLGTVGTHAQGQTLYKKPLYNSLTDFTPVALLAEVPIILTVRKDLPVKNFAEFVAYAQKNQRKMQFGSAGAGSATHLGCVLLNHILKTNITHIPYKGTGPAMIDLAAGRIRLPVRDHHDRQAACRWRHRARAGDLRQGALASAARPADGARAGHQGSHRLHLERHLPAQECAGRRRYPAQFRSGRSHEGAERARQAGRARRQDRDA
jgi:tripartite-type tricarboxylate transporter receptor subunit TctC